MDKKTLDAYDKQAETLSAQYNSLEPKSQFQLMNVFFIKEGRTLDVGCGSGRDLRYLAREGFKALEGCDASAAMLESAKKSKDGGRINFYRDSLPSLSDTDSESYDNVICCGAIMHLPPHELVEAAIHLLRILKDQGVLILSFRGPREESGGEHREQDGRLFTPIHPGQFGLLFETLGARVLHRVAEATEAGTKSWHSLVVRKRAPEPKWFAKSSIHHRRRQEDGYLQARTHPLPSGSLSKPSAKRSLER